MSAVHTTSSTVICPHGSFEWRCGICSHLEGECDYGSCHAMAETSVETVKDNGRREYVAEVRPVCRRHRDVLVGTLGKFEVKASGPVRYTVHIGYREAGR